MMAESKHTPGPWNVSGRLGFGWLVSPNVAVVYGGENSGKTEQGEPNARLIASAPDMLEALKAQQRAEDHNANCPECNGEGSWTECGPCSELFGDAIDLRNAALSRATPS